MPDTKKGPLYPNLKEEIKRAGYTADTIQEALGISRNAANRIKHGSVHIPWGKARIIRDKLFPGVKLNYLFSHDPVQDGLNKFEVNTWYANNVPYLKELRISLLYPDWRELEKQPFYRDLVAYLEHLQIIEI